uniref:Fork-head domain-containing protein n=1 Tax=Knipowitschia caucasica TaxID=637954 RepID=A0AAV2LPA7_KNICA
MTTHGSVALTDWDLDQELRLQTTTDQNFVSDSVYLLRPSSRSRTEDFSWSQTPDSFRPNPWLMVDPNIVCPLHYPLRTTPPESQTTPPHYHDAPLLLKEKVPSLSTNHHALSSLLPPVARVKKPQRKPRGSKRSDRCASVCGSWLRPPVNYSLLIGLALKYSGSLRVQQIYNFTREMFPFFQSAPDGWKNTIRHNLCFNHGFKKTFDRQSSSEGKRTSCCWYLTADGHRRLRDEMLMLAPDTLTQLQRSTANPARVRSETRRADERAAHALECLAQKSNRVECGCFLESLTVFFSGAGNGSWS